MKKIVSIFLLCLFSAILVAETFSYVLDNFDTIELVENDSESETDKDKKEKDISDDFLPERIELYFMVNSPLKSLGLYNTHLRGEFQEITIPPPELG